MNRIEFQEIQQNEVFDPASIYEYASFTQADFYGDWQRDLGRTVKRFLVKEGKETVAYFQLIKYPLLMSKSYLYIPYGPVVKDLSENLLLKIKQELKKIAKKENAIFIRLDFSPTASDKILSKFFTKAPFYTYHSAVFQPRAEWFLELRKTEEDLIMAMHEKTRYSIRLAERKGITAEIITRNFTEYFEDFYSLMSLTAERNGFNIHPKNYYRNIFQNLHKTNSYLSIARYNQKILAINLIVVFGGVSNYVFGASSNEERNRMPTYLAQWKAICYAKHLKCTYYNFGGISTGDSKYKGWEGLTIFKKKFGGEEIIHSNFFDVISSPFWYYLYNFRRFLKK